MAFIDVFAWIILRVLIALTVAVFVRFGTTPGASRAGAGTPGQRP